MLAWLFDTWPRRWFGQSRTIANRNSRGGFLWQDVFFICCVEPVCSPRCMPSCLVWLAQEATRPNGIRQTRGCPRLGFDGKGFGRVAGGIGVAVRAPTLWPGARPSPHGPPVFAHLVRRAVRAPRQAGEAGEAGEARPSVRSTKPGLAEVKPGLERDSAAHRRPGNVQADRAANIFPVPRSSPKLSRVTTGTSRDSSTHSCDSELRGCGEEEKRASRGGRPLEVADAVRTAHARRG